MLSSTWLLNYRISWSGSPCKMMVAWGALRALLFAWCSTPKGRGRRLATPSWSRAWADVCKSKQAVALGTCTGNSMGNWLSRYYAMVTTASTNTTVEGRCDLMNASFTSPGLQGNGSAVALSEVCVLHGQQTGCKPGPHEGASIVLQLECLAMTYVSRNRIHPWKDLEER